MITVSLLAPYLFYGKSEDDANVKAVMLVELGVVSVGGRSLYKHNKETNHTDIVIMAFGYCWYHC